MSGPLTGVRVVDCTTVVLGPWAAQQLGDLGADVVKIESPDGDPFRMTAYGFHGWNRGKRSLVLDLKHADGRAALEDLIRDADAVVENFRAGVMERLGLGWDRLRAI
ncbi:MAG TPA: CoA transferase, partial [Candidatus Acidoferrum sp.]|nr:CoA transferase [Candidatus Acidoferrum sp.]